MVPILIALCQGVRLRTLLYAVLGKVFSYRNMLTIYGPENSLVWHWPGQEE